MIFGEFLKYCWKPVSAYLNALGENGYAENSRLISRSSFKRRNSTDGIEQISLKKQKRVRRLDEEKLDVFLPHALKKNMDPFRKNIVFNLKDKKAFLPYRCQEGSMAVYLIRHQNVSLYAVEEGRILMWPVLASAVEGIMQGSVFRLDYLGSQKKNIFSYGIDASCAPKVSSAVAYFIMQKEKPICCLKPLLHNDPYHKFLLKDVKEHFLSQQQQPILLSLSSLSCSEKEDLTHHFLNCQEKSLNVLYALAAQTGAAFQFFNAAERNVALALKEEIQKLQKMAYREQAYPGIEDLSHLPFMSVDLMYAKSIEQAFYIEPVIEEDSVLQAPYDVNPKKYRVFYAVSDALFLCEQDPHKETMFRCAEKYLKTFILSAKAPEELGPNSPMLPADVAFDAGSLNEDQVRPTLLLRFVLYDDGRIEDCQFQRAFIKNHYAKSFKNLQNKYNTGYGLFSSKEKSVKRLNRECEDFCVNGVSVLQVETPDEKQQN